MNNLEEFNKNLESLEKEVSNLAAIREAYQKVDKLSKEYEQIIINLKAAIKSLESAVSDLKQQKSIIEASTENQKTLIDNKFGTIKTKLDDEFKKLDRLFDEKTEKINDDNKKFYKEFVDTVQIRLDNHKGEIQRLIEHERLEIKEMFNKQTEFFEKKIKHLMIISLCLGISIIAFCGVILMLFT